MTIPQRTIVVIGGAGGGPTAASRAREFDEDARIVLVEKKPHVSWVQAGLRHHLEGRVQRLQQLDEDRREFFASRHRIELRTNTEAVRIDPDSQRVVLRTGGQGQEALRYDAVIFSGGAEVMPPPVAGLGGPRVTGFRTVDDLVAIQTAIQQGAKRAVVVGCGPFGVDAACGLRSAGLEVDVIERSDRILPAMSLLGARAAVLALARVGARVHLQEDIAQSTPLGAGLRLSLKSGKSIDADLVVLTSGLRPRTQLLAEAGAALNSDGTVRVDAHMETTLPRVYACGTAISVTHAVTRRPLWLPQAAVATRSAQIAGHNAAVDRPREALSPLAGTALYLVGEERFARTGLSESDARKALGDGNVIAVTIHGYAGEAWIGGDAMCVRLVVDRIAGVVVGGEVWGREGVPRRIDLIAAAVVNGWSPARVTDLDMAYAPMLGPSFDPIQIAGQVAAKTLTGEANPVGAEALALRVLKGEVALLDVSRPGTAGTWPPGTLQIPLEALREHLADLPRDKPLVVVSQTGQRGYLAWRILKQRGFSASHLDGGALSYKLTQG